MMGRKPPAAEARGGTDSAAFGRFKNVRMLWFRNPGLGILVPVHPGQATREKQKEKITVTATRILQSMVRNMPALRWAINVTFSGRDSAGSTSGLAAARPRSPISPST